MRHNRDLTKTGTKISCIKRVNFMKLTVLFHERMYLYKTNPENPQQTIHFWKGYILLSYIEFFLIKSCHRGNHRKGLFTRNCTKKLKILGRIYTKPYFWKGINENWSNKWVYQIKPIKCHKPHLNWDAWSKPTCVWNWWFSCPKCSFYAILPICIIFLTKLEGDLYFLSLHIMP